MEFLKNQNEGHVTPNHSCAHSLFLSLSILLATLGFQRVYERNCFNRAFRNGIICARAFSQIETIGNDPGKGALVRRIRRQILADLEGTNDLVEDWLPGVITEVTTDCSISFRKSANTSVLPALLVPIFNNSSAESSDALALMVITSLSEYGAGIASQFAGTRSALELRLLQYFCAHSNEEVCTKEDLDRHVWRHDVYESGDIFDNDQRLTALVKRLRHKLEDGQDWTYIHAVRGRGYQFKQPGHEM